MRTRIIAFARFAGIALPLLLIAWLPFSGALAAESPVKTVKVNRAFADVFDGVKQAIEGKGINIAHTLPAADMLNRTGKDFGVEKNVFNKAETVEFCSAKISHQLAQANPENIVLCPFTISIYELASDPKNTYLSWRRPASFDDEKTKAAVAEVVKLIEGIIAEATAW